MMADVVLVFRAVERVERAARDVAPHRTLHGGYADIPERQNEFMFQIILIF